MIDIRELCFGYNSKKIVLTDLSASFAPGKVTSILGRNGSGKSTLLKNINNVLKPQSGCVYIDGKTVGGMTSRQIAREVGFLSQRSEGIDAVVMDALLTGRRPYMGFGMSGEDKSIADRVLKQMGLTELACRKTTEISGGELQKVVIARALVQEPKVLLLDEPVNHLDMVNQLDVLGLIREITLEKNLTTVIVMHDINTALRFSDELVFMKDGILEAKCTSDQISRDVIQSVFGLQVEIINQQNRIIVVPD